jgi:UDP-glucuronate 4-epimerase
MKKILVTGTAGFIGFHTANKFIQSGYEVYGLDCINDYYDINIKYSRLAKHGIVKEEIVEKQILHSKVHKNYFFIKADLSDHEFVVSFMKNHLFDVVINLAAQAGVRYSLENPRVYTKSNIDGFLSILEGCRNSNVGHLIYASTSSVYGLNTCMPLKETQPTEHPMALYAATKKANELMAHSYSHLFGIPSTGLRFFTVYGPWGRPDMALFLFTKAILANQPINIFNHGKMIRDFTYVLDVVESIFRLIDLPPKENNSWNSLLPNASESSAPYQIFNVGNSNPVSLETYIGQIENHLGKKAKKNYLPMQAGDVPETMSDTSLLEDYINFRPSTSIENGIKDFMEWYLNYFHASTGY